MNHICEDIMSHTVSFCHLCLPIKTLINCDASAVSKNMDQANQQPLLSNRLPLFLYLILNFIHLLPCSLTNRVMQHTGMFQGWQL